jgi:hypothetical protein
MKIPKEYGGLGLSQVNYNRAIALVASHCGSTAVWLSAHQSIGVPQPLKLFGTPEQKHEWLPKFAKGAVSAFALTEPEAGSDPAKMSTTATPVEDGKAYLLTASLCAPTAWWPTSSSWPHPDTRPRKPRRSRPSWSTPHPGFNYRDRAAFWASAPSERRHPLDNQGCLPRTRHGPGRF